VRILAERIKSQGGKVPGFGHPLHNPVDPRTQRILELAEDASRPRFATLARVVGRVVPEVWGKPLPMNVSMAIAAVLLDLGFPAGMLTSVPILARTASLLAHLAEEAENPIGFLMASKAEAAIAYQPGDGP
jgi:citrate synthase